MAGTAFAQKPGSLAANQTYGFGAGKLLKFTYTENFDCIDQPNSDLNFNGIPADMDPGEMQIPICQVGTQPTINPPGRVGNPAITTEPLYVLAPLFSVDNDQNPNDAISCDNVVTGTLCGPALGSTLITLFGSLPEAFKAKPMVYTQCPDPGTAPGTCTMHASRLDLGPALVALGLLPPPTTNVFVPTPNHSHVVINPGHQHQGDLVAGDPGSGLQPDRLAERKWHLRHHVGTRSAGCRAVAGNATEVPSNFFLFFSSYTTSSSDHMQMH